MPFQWPVRVYIEDTDTGGIVYYVNYLKFMERARTELLRHHGVSQQSLADEDIIFVVTHAECDYRKPARLDDELLIDVEIQSVSPTRVTFSQRIVRSSDSVLLCQGRIIVACVTATQMKPRRWPANLIEQLTNGLGPQLAVEEK